MQVSCLEARRQFMVLCVVSQTGMLDSAKVLTSRKIVFYNKEQVLSFLSKQSFHSKIDNLGAKVVVWGCELSCS